VCLRGPPRRHCFVVVLVEKATDRPMQLRRELSGEDVSGAQVDRRAMLSTDRDMRALVLFKEVEPEGVTSDLGPPRRHFVAPLEIGSHARYADAKVDASEPG
jgi:hypothetical protein